MASFRQDHRREHFSRPLQPVCILRERRRRFGCMGRRQRERLMHCPEPMPPSLYSSHIQCRSRTFRCDHVYRALGVCQFFYGMSIFQTPNIPDGLVQFNFYIGVLALSAEYQQPVRHSRSL
jgi:hypothetical protein